MKRKDEEACELMACVCYILWEMHIYILCCLVIKQNESEKKKASESEVRYNAVILKCSHP